MACAFIKVGFSRDKKKIASGLCLGLRSSKIQSPFAFLPKKNFFNPASLSPKTPPCSCFNPSCNFLPFPGCFCSAPIPQAFNQTHPALLSFVLPGFNSGSCPAFQAVFAWGVLRGKMAVVLRNLHLAHAPRFACRRGKAKDMGKERICRRGKAKICCTKTGNTGAKRKSCQHRP